MIPILYEKSESVFTHNGIGFLRDAIKVTVTEERNGTYELSMQYPTTGQWYSRIANGSIIKAKANETSMPQLFRIYKSSKPLKGVVTYSAEHISYDLCGVPTLGLSIETATPQAAITKGINEAGLPCPFTAYSDISTLNSTNITKPCSVRALLGGQKGSVLDVWGGEYEFDNFVVKLHKHRGSDNGVTIAYGKNLKDLKQESNIAECYTHIMPYAIYTENGTDGEKQEVYVSLTEKVLPLTTAENIGHSKAYIIDLTKLFGEGEEITETALREKATEYAQTAALGVPKVNITVSFIQLWQTEEYKNIAPLERVRMCDTVAVRFEKLGVTAAAKVIKTVYDSLKEKYESVTLGEPKATLADTVKQQADETAQLEDAMKKGQEQASEELKKAILNATNLITGHAGGYVVFNPAEMPQEILILDTPTIEEAVNVWRWNSGGLGHSSTGYNGEYSTAITMDGSIVADFVNVGTLKAIDLYACTIKGGTMNINDKFIVTANGDATVEGKVIAKSGEIGGCVIENGVLKIKNANIAEKLTAGNIDVTGVITAGGIAVKGDITAEVTRATEAEGNLSSRITANAEGITAETYRATLAEGNLSSRITTTAESITAEVTRATEAEGNLSSRITANAEGITAETYRATLAEGNLSSRITTTAESITAEVTRATEAEGNLSSRISANATSINAKVSATGGSKSSFGWELTTSGFTLTANNNQVMKVTSSGLEVAGKIKATSGTLDNCTINNNCTIYGTIKSAQGWQYTNGNVINQLYFGRQYSSDDNAIRLSSFCDTSHGFQAELYMYADTSGKYGGYSLGLDYQTSEQWIDAGIRGGAYEYSDTVSSGLFPPRTELLLHSYTGSIRVEVAYTFSSNEYLSVDSDENLKHDIVSLDNDSVEKYDCFFDNLTPIKFKYNHSLSNRFHLGFGAGATKEAILNSGLSTQDFAGYIEYEHIDYKNKKTELRKALRYEEFISLNTWQIQKLKARVAELERKLSV